MRFRNHALTSDTVPPAFIVYLFGHLRSFRFISHTQRQQFDQFAEGRPYLVFLHTWTERDHDQPVWYRAHRRKISAPENVAIKRNFSAISVLRNRSLNGLYDVMAMAQIDRHPGLPAFAAECNVSQRDRATCDRKVLARFQLTTADIVAIRAVDSLLRLPLGSAGRRA